MRFQVTCYLVFGLSIQGLLAVSNLSVERNQNSKANGYIAFTSHLQYSQDTNTLFPDWGHLLALAQEGYNEMASQFDPLEIGNKRRPAAMAVLAVGNDVSVFLSVTFQSSWCVDFPRKLNQIGTRYPLS